MQNLVTVFGGTGFVGRQVVRALAKRGWRVRVAVRNVGRGYRLRMLGDVGQISVVQANIRDEASVRRALDGASAVVNAVGATHETGKQSFEAVHVEGAGALARTAHALGITNFVQFSGIGVDEASPSRYSAARARGEAAVRAAMPSAVILRPSVIFGPDDILFNQLGRLAALSPIMPVLGDDAVRMQPVFVGDVAAAVAAVLGDPASAGRTYELGGPATYSFRDLAQLVLTETGRKRLLVALPTPLANLVGWVGEIAGGMLPITPPLTRDQVILFSLDNIVTAGATGLAELGVVPTPVEAIVPSYLYRYRRGGQYAPVPAGAY
ncbi:MAG: 3-beta hydroxysteroid dehydrogenase [Caulobacteraceae bacterium]|nr:3-beta hydroxysteroid dehydrogenase [Caulobacteraceae bacterium]